MAKAVSFLSSTAMPVQWIDTSHYITAIGCNLAIASIQNPTEYEFLEGHSQIITTFALNKSRNICVSGQCGKESHEESSVPAIVWDLTSRSQLLLLRGHKSKITHIAVSDDGRMVAISDEFTRNIWIWDIQERDLACILQSPESVSSLAFSDQRTDEWYLHVVSNIKIVEFKIIFDPRTFEYRNESKFYANPTTGYKRTSDSIFCSSDYLFVGTHLGELSIYNTTSATIRASIPVDNFSISCISANDSGNTVIVCGRNISIVQGEDKKWNLIKQIDIGKPIISISVLNSIALLRTVDTGIYLFDTKRYSHEILLRGTTHAPLTFSISSNTIAVALGENGLTLLNIEDGKLLFDSYHFKIKATSISNTPLNDFIIGCNDGTLLQINNIGKVQWTTERVHRGKITSLCVTNDFIASGGDDGMIRIITHKSRSIVNELLVHNGPVFQIIPSFGYPQRIISVSQDKTVTTTDVSNGKRIYQELTSMRILFTSIAQFKDGENEILVAKGDGKVVAYDWPKEGIIFQTESPQKLQINSIDLRPNSRVLACGGESEYISFVDFNNNMRWKLSDPAHSTPVRCVKWTKSGKYLVSAADDGICLWCV
ncbi:WD40 repeat-containing protein [Histomonas meleagridis]|uniref:WD40 repeat-containing protein n=1 Tax=Histomonas meleagridis TaxID=135588 RepID=UPI0035594B0F|nr:WD40 repeat-containing protein [Histomonas meleagridis]KAH0803485.1 WD40 repeat-containing protein [Histomonas meleagridis]